MQDAVDKANELVAETQRNAILLRQFKNPANPAIHKKTTGPEIWNDTDGTVDIFVAGVGTGGTISGVSCCIKNTQGKAITSVAVESADSPLISQSKAGQTIKPGPHKIQGIGANFIPGNLDIDLVGEVKTVSNDEAISMTHRLMSEEGTLAGISCRK
jgi:cysteine synthase A